MFLVISEPSPQFMGLFTNCAFSQLPFHLLSPAFLSLAFFFCVFMGTLHLFLSNFCLSEKHFQNLTNVLNFEYCNSNAFNVYIVKSFSTTIFSFPDTVFWSPTQGMKRVFGVIKEVLDHICAQEQQPCREPI